ncbi:MAG: hypothetical protein IIA45_09430, partial [Bacteroidetes bacterium]|nr:hypothetical protein [Bacteroidota bacterium]
MKKLRPILLSAFIIAFSLIPMKNYASHCVGADLKYEWLGGLDYEVTLYFYRDCIGVPAPGTIGVKWTSISCGLTVTTTIYPIDTVDVTPLCPVQSSKCQSSSSPYPGIEQHTYQGKITLPKACNDWLFSWGTC